MIQMDSVNLDRIHLNIEPIDQRVYYKISQLCIINLALLSKMIEEPEVRPPKEKKTLYPKSAKGKVAKIQYETHNFKAELLSKKYLAFGDSFVNMFLHVQNAFHIKLKGKSIKGLAKADNQDREHIQKWVKASRKETRLIFNFGQVDLNLMRYYKVAHQEDYPQQTFQEYISWISTLNRKTYVIGVFASPIKRQDIIGVLGKYGTLQGVECEQELLLREYDQTQNTRKRWNDLISSACTKYGVKFINIFEHHEEIDPMFIDQNPKTIHLRYLPCILMVKQHLKDMVIDVDRALQIEDQYEIVKTQRYYENLKLLEQKARLQSQQTKTQNGSSKGAFQEDQSSSTKLDNFQPENQSSKSHCQSEKLSNQQNNNDPAQNGDQSGKEDVFIALLQIPNIKSASIFFKQLVQPSDQNVLYKMSENMILKGIKWANSVEHNNQFSSLLTLLRDIQSLRNDKVESTCKGYSNFQILFISTLQKIFYDKLQANIDDQDFGIQNVINFIILTSISQEDLKHNILSLKIVLIITRQLFCSLFLKIVSREEHQKNQILVQYNCLYKIQNVFRKKMNEAYLKRIKKQKFDQSQAQIILLQTISFNHTNQKQAHQKSIKFNQLIFRLYPYVIFQKRIFSRVLISFEIQILLKNTDIKIKKVTQCLQKNQINLLSRLQKKIQKSEKKLSGKKKKKKQQCGQNKDNPI